MYTKVCSKCGKEKAISDYHKSKLGRLGTRKDCKECVGKRLKKHREDNLEKYVIKEKLKRNKERDTFEGRIRKMYHAAKSRAKKYNREFTIEIQDLIDIYPITNKCPILDLELKWNCDGVKDTSPSLDRIDSTIGYTKNNIQIISVRANRIKNDATVEELEKILNYLKFN